MDLHELFGDHLGQATITVVNQKVSFQDADYTDGTYPWCCGTCKHFNWSEGSQGNCALVVGPYDGLVEAEDTCRLYHPKPMSFGLAPPDEDSEAPQAPSEPSQDTEEY